MRHARWVIGTAMLTLALSGCCTAPRVDTVPWWKGIPSMLIAPSSLEAMAWRDHFRQRRAQRCLLDSCGGCSSCTPSCFTGSAVIQGPAIESIEIPYADADIQTIEPPEPELPEAELPEAELPELLEPSELDF